MSQTPLYTSADIREIERIQIHERGTLGYSLMCRAAESAFERCLSFLPPGARALVLVGPGNNGGDGYVIAKRLCETGYGVTVIALTDPKDLKGDAATAFRDYRTVGEVQAFSGELPKADLIIDALLGTGLERPLKGDFLVVVQLINAQPAPVIAVDIPSGLNSDTGLAMGSAVKAMETVTFIGVKRGLVIADGPHYAGKITLRDLGVDRDLLSKPSETLILDASYIQNTLFPRPTDCHKGTFGHAMLVGGNRGYGGAIRMACEAAARSGAGLVTAITQPAHAALISAQRPEIMTIPLALDDTDELDHLKHASSIGLGPGLGSDDWSAVLFEHVTRLSTPTVVDADALNALANAPFHSNHWVLTPHPGEAARLLDCTTRDIQADRTAAVKAIQQQYGGIVVLKGSGTLIFDGHSLWQNQGGNPGMASGGMGDVLTGIITGLMGQLGNSLSSTLCGVAVHTTAADLAAGASPRGLLAMDVVQHIRDVVNPVNTPSRTSKHTHRV